MWIPVSIFKILSIAFLPKFNFAVVTVLLVIHSKIYVIFKVRDLIY